MTQQRLVWASIAAAVISLALYAGFVLLADAGPTLAALRRLDAPGWALVLALSLGNYLFRFARWARVVGWVSGVGSVRLPVLDHLLYYIGGFVFTATPGKAGEMVRGMFLKSRGVGHDASFSAFLYERILDLVAVAILASLTVLAFPQYRWVLAVCIALIALLWAVLRHPGLQVRLARAQRAALRHAADALAHTGRLLTWRPALAGLAVGLLAWGCEALGFHVVLRGLGAPVPVTLAVGIYALSMLAGAVSFIPGGLGSAEAIMVACLHLAGVALPTAVAATIICRVATLWFAVVLGALACGAVALRRHRDVAQRHAKI